MNERCSQMGDRDTGNGFLCAFAPFALCVKIGPFTFSGERASTQRRGDAKTRRRQAAINPQMIADSHRWETGIQQRRQGKMVSFAPSRLLPFALKPARPRSRGSGHQRKDAETPSRYQSADDRRFSQVGDRDTTKTPGKMISFAPSRLLPFALILARPRYRGSGHQRKDAETPSRY